MNFLEKGVAIGGDPLTGSGVMSFRSRVVFTCIGIVAILGAVGGLSAGL